MCFDIERFECFSLSGFVDTCQQYGFADPAKPHQDAALSGFRQSDTAERDTDVIENGGTTDKFRRWIARTRCEWIANRIHTRPPLATLPVYTKFPVKMDKLVQRAIDAMAARGVPHPVAGTRLTGRPGSGTVSPG